MNFEIVVVWVALGVSWNLAPVVLSLPKVKGVTSLVQATACGLRFRVAVRAVDLSTFPFVGRERVE